jgi:sugar lactone lactonase YvrE
MGGTMSAREDRGLDIRCVVDAGNACGEGPLWHPAHEAIYWTDINGFSIHRYRPGDGQVRVWRFGEPVCALSLTTDPDRLLVALGSQVILWDTGTDVCTLLARPEPDTPRHRLNDGATDPTGAFWVGSMPNNVAPDGSPSAIAGYTGSLFRITPDGEVTTWDHGFGITNTVAWSPDQRTFYCGCSVSNVIYVYDFDVSTRSIANRRPLLAGLARGLPDGSAVDTEGYLWNCRFFGHCIVRVSPTGEMDRVIEMPVSNVTNCAFGGHDLRTLYVTSAALEAPTGESLGGGLFSLRTPVSGLPTTPFRIATASSSLQDG